MGVLQGKRLYLSGPIEHHDKQQDNWRVGPRNIFAKRFGLSVFDPFDDPKQQWAALLKEAQGKKDYETMTRISRSFVRKDLCLVDRADMVVAYLPYKVPTTGTHHEIINSNNAKKPTLLVTNMDDVAHIPLWYFGFIPVECMFAGFPALYEYLQNVDMGKYRNNDRWSYVYGDI